VRLYLEKYPTQRRAGGVAQIVECLLCKCEGLSSNTNTPERRERNVKKKPVRRLL
jgi:hypothetical protein